MLEHQTQHIIAAHAATSLVDVLEQVRSANGAPLAVALDSLSLVFATPDHFRALDVGDVLPRRTIPAPSRLPRLAG